MIQRAAGRLVLALSPFSDDFIVAPDGSFIDEQWRRGSLTADANGLAI